MMVLFLTIFATQTYLNTQVDVENKPIEIHLRVENTILPDHEAPADSLLVLTVTSHALGRTIFQDKVYLIVLIQFA